MAQSKHPVSIIVSAVDRATAPMRKIEGTIERTLKPVRRLKGAMRLEYGRSGIPQFLKGFRQLGTGVLRTAGAVAGLVVKLGLAATAGAGAALALLRHFAAAGDEIAKFSAKVGVSTEKVQLWRYAAESAGVETQTFNASIQSFGIRAAEAAAGSAEAAAAFDALGISTLSANGSVRSIESLLPDVADAMSRIEDESLRNAIAMRLFEAEGVGLVNMLKDGSAGLEAMEDRGRELGIVLTAKAAKGGERFTQALTDIMGMLRGLGGMIAVEVMPYVSEFFERLTGDASTTRERIREFVEAFMDKLPGRLDVLKTKLRELWEGLQPVLQRFRQMASWLAQNDRWVGVLAVGLAAFSALLLGPLVAGLATVTAGIVSLGVALLTTPVGWIMLGIAALVAGLLWLGQHWDWLGDKIDVVIDWIGSRLEDLLGWALDTFESISGWIKGLFGDDGEVQATVNRVDSVTRDFDGGGRPGAVPPPGGLGGLTADDVLNGTRAPGGAPAPPEPAEVRIKVDDLPPGWQVEQTRRGTAPVALDVGHALPEMGT